MAEYLARSQSLGEDVEFSSAGTGTRDGNEPASFAVDVMAEWGIPIQDHRSRSVWELGPAADVIYALSEEHRDAMVSWWPERGGDIHLLRPDGRSIADPYGQDAEAYRRARDKIAAAVRERIATGWA